MMHPPPERIDILGCPFDAVTFDEAVSRICTAIEARERLHVGVGNVDMVMKTRALPAFRDLFNACGLVICDGVPVTWSAAALGTPLKGRVSGTDLVWECGAISEKTGGLIAMIGAQFVNTQHAAEAMQTRFPKAKLQAFDTPYPLTDAANDALVAAIREAGAVMVLVALGAPKQEQWIRDNLDASGACVGIGIGSAFDIIGGAMPRAPRWMRDNGLEWLHRTFQDPKRLGKRYLIDDLPFFWHVAVAVIRRRFGQNSSTNHE